MSTNNSTPENSIVSEEIDHQITGPHYEPSVPNATTYWRCESCNRKPIREQDLYREAFHAEGCEVAEQC